jgi:5-methylcytosine-specific restriction enzyme A
MGIKLAPGRLGAVSGGRFKHDAETRAAKRADPFYVSPEWRAFRDQLFKERGRRCEDPKCSTPRGPWKQVYGDHIIEIKDGGAKLSRDNVLLRCGVCHGRKTQDERERRIRSMHPAWGQGG